MASIKLNDLIRNSIIGVDLFNDSESFIRDLSDNELDLPGGFLYRFEGIPTVIVIRPF
jgi:hypothetical protein